MNDRGLSSMSKKVFLTVCPFLHNVPKDFPIFYMRVEDIKAHYLRQMVFWKKLLIQDYSFFLLFWPFFQNGSKDLSNILGPLFEEDGFSKKFLSRGLSDQKDFFLSFSGWQKIGYFTCTRKKGLQLHWPISVVIFTHIHLPNPTSHTRTQRYRYTPQMT